MNARIGSLVLLVAVLAVAAAAPGCLTRRGESVGRAPQLDGKELRGRKVYMEYCHQCHPDGRAGVAPGIVDKPVPEAVMKLQVRKGIGTMPGFDEKKIGDDSLDDLMAYIETLRHAGSGH